MRWVAVLVAVTFCALGAQDRKGREDELVDKDYRFRLVTPDAGWRLLREDEAREIVGDAVAMLVSPPGLYLAVIVEHAPGVDHSAMADNIREWMPIEERVDEKQEEIQFQGRAATRFQVSGVVSGLHLRYLNTVFTSGDCLYQLVCWGSCELVDDDARAFAPALGAFTLLEGEPRGRRAERESLDARGVGWSMEDGVFRSAPYDLRVTARGPWRVVVDEELAKLNTDAEVGLACERPDLYLVVIAERVLGFPAAELAAELRRDFALELEPAGKPRRARIAGIELPLDVLHSGDSVGTIYAYGAFARGEICYQVLAWFLGPRDEKKLELLSSACASVRFLASTERDALVERLAALPDPDDEIGPDYSIRSGVYRDFGAAFTWRKPGGWRVRGGQVAREDSGDEGRLLLEEPSLGVHGIVSVWESYGTAEEEHEESVYDLLGEEPPAPAQRIELDGTTVFDSTVTTVWDDRPVSYRLITAQAGGRSYEILFSGFEQNVTAASPALVVARDAFRLGEELPAPGVRDGIYVDERLGFSLEAPGPDWTSNTALVPGEMAKLAGSCGWTDGAGREVFAIAFGAGGADDPSGIEKLVLGEFERRLGAGKEHAAEFAGLPARRRSFDDSGGKLDVLLARRENTFFVFGVGSHDGSPTLDEAEELFSFLP